MTLTEALNPYTATMRHVASSNADQLPADVFVGARRGDEALHVVLDLSEHPDSGTPEIRFTAKQTAALVWYLVLAFEDCELVGDGVPGRLMRKRDRAVVEAFRLGERVGERRI